MSAAFDTIKREKLMEILASIVDEDELRMIRVLSNISLNIKLRGADTESFVINVGSPQGDAISGVLFNIYLENALRRVRAKLNAADTNIEHCYANTHTTSMPAEMIYADDSDFPTENAARKEEVLITTYSIFPEHNLKINEDKTEHTLVKRGSREEEKA